MVSASNLIFFFWITATEYHLGLLKAKLAKYRQQLLEPSGKAGAKVIHIKADESMSILPTCEFPSLHVSTIAEGNQGKFGGKFP